jgi:hypothetical protein
MATSTGNHPYRLAAVAFASESAVYGVVLVSGLLVIVANQNEASASEVLVKVLGTCLVFWLAHLYAGTVAHLGDHHDEEFSERERLLRAVRHAVEHSWGMLGATIVPALILGLGAAGVITHANAIWGTLWVDVAILAVLGYLGVSRWTPAIWVRLLGGLGTAALGVVLIFLKAFIH